MDDHKLSACLTKLRMFMGLPPYDGVGNVVRSDPYFLESIHRDYDATTRHRADGCVARELAEWEKTRKAHIELYAANPDGAAWPLNGDDEFSAVIAMKNYGGSFASSIAKAWQVADQGNLRLLRKTFGELLLSYYNQYIKKGA